MTNKYSVHGYIKLWIPGSDNEKKLNVLRSYIASPNELRDIFERMYDEETEAKG